jgi:hypothetical protein
MIKTNCSGREKTLLESTMRVAADDPILLYSSMLEEYLIKLNSYHVSIMEDYHFN